MSNARADRVTQTLLLIISAAVLLAMPPDGRLIGGKHLADADVILRGGIPYRDFWTMYAPGHYYLLAGLLALFGRHWVVSGLAAGACFAVGVPLFHGLLRQLGASRAWALMGAALLLGAGLATPFSREFGTYAPTLVLLLLAWRGYLRRLAEHAAPARLFSTGLWLGAAALCKHDVAAYSALAMASGLALDGFLQGAMGRTVRSVGWMALGAILVFGPPMAVLASLAGPDLFRDLFVFPATSFRFARPESYPDLLPYVIYDHSGSRRGWLFAICRWATFALPLAAAVSGGLLALVRRPAGRTDGDMRPAFLALGVVFALHFAVAHVQINTHIVSMTIYGAALAVALDVGWAQGRQRRRAFLLAAGLGWMGVLIAEPVLTPLLTRSDDHLVALGLPGARSVRVFPESAVDLRKLWALVQAQVPPGDPIFVAELRNDVVLSNGVELYFLMDRPGATRYYEMHPAVTDTAAVQRKMVERLQATRPRLVLLRKGFDDSVLDSFEKELRQHVPGVGSEILDDYLRGHYHQIAVLGRVHVMAPGGAAGVPAVVHERDALPGTGPLR